MRIHSLFCEPVRLALGLIMLVSGCSSPPPHVKAKPTTPPAQPPLTPVRVAQPCIQAPRQEPVLIVQPTRSAGSEADRHYAEKITARLATWLREMGLVTVQVTDEQLPASLRPTTRVVILPANATLSSGETGALRHFTDRGGKLLVFFSEDSGLGDIMGVRVAPALKAAGLEGWSAFRFTDDGPAGIPRTLQQDSRSLRPIAPAGSGAKVIAWWVTGPAGSGRQPAWIEGPHGFWMSHILLEGDVDNKKQMLAGLLTACDPDLGKVAAAWALNHAGTVGCFGSLDEAVQTITHLAGENGTAGRVSLLLNELTALRLALRDACQSGDALATLRTAGQIDHKVMEAFAAAQTGKPGEFRGVWNQSGTGFSPGQWDRSCQELRNGGMTAILPNVHRPWCAHYPTPLIPPSDALQHFGNQLAACLEAARAHHLQTHAWAILWSLEGAPDAILDHYRHSGRLQVAADGSTVSWLCPSHPDNRALELSLLNDLARRYPALDGIQLDYIRFKSGDTCYCNGCRERFARETGIRVKYWPIEVRSGPRAVAFRQWRRELITRFVAEVRTSLRQINPKLKLSASVYAGYPGCAESIGQDWGYWLRQDLVDFVCPMNYTADEAKFATWYRKQAMIPGSSGKIFPGIGVTTLECRLNAVQTINQIKRLRAEGAPGFALFEANPTLGGDILPYLGAGLTGSR